ncbi:MAG: hypothetical protein ACM3Q4_14375 [Acidobacteriota bacterium]
MSDETSLDLLTLTDVEPPSGDLGIKGGVSHCRALWTSPLPGEEGAPMHRIIHARTLELHAPATLSRLGIRRAQGYHKCGSHTELDWVEDVRVLAWQDDRWNAVLYKTGLPRPETEGEIIWLDLGGIATSSVQIEIRKCGIDPWWPSWNLASGAFILEGIAPSVAAPKHERRLVSTVDVLSDLPSGVTAERLNGEVRYRTRFYELGFCLGRTGFSYLSIDDEGRGRTQTNLLRLSPGIFLQGIRLHPVGSAAAASPLIRYDAEGTTVIGGNTVIYTVDFPSAGQHYSLTFRMFEDHFTLDAERTGMKPLHAWESSLWATAMNASASASTVLGSIVRRGQTGCLIPPAYMHAPGFGTFDASSDSPNVLFRSDAFRPMNMGLMEIKLGEELQVEGDYLLLPGTHRAAITFSVDQVSVPLKEETPEEVARAVRRCALTSLSYRADTSTLSNNGNSMHCPICMDTWSAAALGIGTIFPGLRAMDLVRDSIERWLDGGPGYASGRMFKNGSIHEAEDEYLMTGTAALLGLADFLAESGTPEWVARFDRRLAHHIALMRARDLDGDGLIESDFRQGVTGSMAWSTNWFDVISFGWKDAFANALLYAALVKLADVLPRLGAAHLAHGMDAWARTLKKNYLPTFFNPETGWLAGWRCKEGKLHDYAFLAVNGAAVTSGVVDRETSRSMIRKLYEEMLHVGLDNWRNGLPGNLWCVPDEDMTEIMQGFSMGYYANGGLTHSQSRHFVGALYEAGMEAEADRMLEQLCEGLGNATAFGGSKSGIDWRFWDGWPCGYEGLLTDQFGILAVAMKRYRSTQSR